MKSLRKSYQHKDEVRSIVHEMIQILLQENYVQSVKALELVTDGSNTQKIHTASENNQKAQGVFSLYQDRVKLGLAGLDPDRLIALSLMHERINRESFEARPDLLFTLLDHFDQAFAEDVFALDQEPFGVRLPPEHYYKTLTTRPYGLIVKLYHHKDNVPLMYELTAAAQFAYDQETDQLLSASYDVLHQAPELEPLVHDLVRTIDATLDVRLGLLKAMAQDPFGVQRVVRAYADNGVFLNGPVRNDGSLSVWRREARTREYT